MSEAAGSFGHPFAIGAHRPAPDADRPALPDRYAVKEDEQGRYLTCLEAPTVSVRGQRGFEVGSAAARKYPEGSIFLDGAAQGEPFMDPERDVYNLDHHEGCVRSFTLAACEQAFVVIRKGLDLRERDWTVWINEPDLDTVLAIWLFLNHMRINHEDPEIRRAIAPLLRLEGVIDAQGPELTELTGFAEELLQLTRARIDFLRERELELKRRGEWNEIDILEYTAELLRKIDGLIYSSLHFAGFKDIEVLARGPLGASRSVVVCRSELGIYEVEQHLRTLHGSRLGILVLQKSSSNYTLRQVDSFLPANLERAYETLNQLDPAASRGRSGNRWGGSGEIGGSPRGSGTELSPEQIVEALQLAYRKPSPWHNTLRIAHSFVLGITVVGAALLARLEWLPSRPPLGGPHANAELSFAIVAVIFSAALLLLFARRYPRLYGLRWPAGWDGWLLWPLAALSALVGGAWIPNRLTGFADFGVDQVLSDLAAVLAMPLAAELLFRGLVHGILVQNFRVQVEGGRWFLSRPAFLSALFYALGSGAFALETVGRRPEMWSFPLLLAGAFVFGIGCAMARERSGSLLLPIVFHWSAAALVLALRA
ncbi:MAG TPA: CPBP family intramembrane glutamic endopeptidase [Acidobacteriota bacterium]